MSYPTIQLKTLLRISQLIRSLGRTNSRGIRRTCGGGRQRRRVSESHDGRGFEAFFVIVFVVIVVILVGVVVVVVVVGIGKIVVVVEFGEQRRRTARLQKLFQRNLEKQIRFDLT